MFVLTSTFLLAEMLCPFTYYISFCITIDELSNVYVEGVDERNLAFGKAPQMTSPPSS